MRILITGITGFVGSHLAEYCLQKPNVKVYGTVLPNCPKDELKRIEHIKDKIELLECDLTKKKISR
jgi:GDP-4-dehydro-6-deoxy-D-mannose reductase